MRAEVHPEWISFFFLLRVKEKSFIPEYLTPLLIITNPKGPQVSPALKLSKDKSGELELVRR